MISKDVKKVFISTPITGFEIKQVRANCNNAKEILKAQYPNIEFISPFDIDWVPDMPDSWYMGRDIEALIDCDAIISMNGWIKSKGCLVERFTANIYGLKIYDYEDLIG